MFVSVKPFKIKAIAGVKSNNIVDVKDVCKGIASEKKIQRLIKDTGFKRLSVVDSGVCASDMCCQAAEYLINTLKIDKSSIGALVFITQSSDYMGFSTAFVLQKRLGLPKSLIAFDMILGCSGFVYGLYQAALMLPSLNGKKVLLCCGDVLRAFMNPNAPGKAAIGGDAGACAVIESGENSGDDIYFNIESYGDKFDALYMPNGGARNPYTFKDNRINVDDVNNFSVMDGLAMLDFTLNEVAENIKDLLNFKKIPKTDIDAYLLHQPNYILVKGIREKLGLAEEQVIHNLENIGNISSASIPLLLTEIGKDWQNRKNTKVLMSGFGIGLCVASTILNLKDTLCVDTLSYDSKYTYKHKQERIVD